MKLALLLLATSAVAADAQKYRNVSDVPFATLSNGPQEAVVVDVDSVSPPTLYPAIVARIQSIQAAMTRGGEKAIAETKRRGRMRTDVPFTLSHVVLLRRNGSLLIPKTARGGPGAQACLSLDFSTAPGETFAQDYRNVLQAAFDQATPVMDGLYGSPYACGPIKVVNYDSTIGDRDAVVGGIFLPSDPNHGGLPTILFPKYNRFATAAVNFINLLIHAYHGVVTFSFDAWEQGFARAATMKVVRQIYPDSNPFSDGTKALDDIDALYEGRQYYDWSNQPPLSNNSFIAPSLKDEPIPGGVTGGMFIPRYKMAGSAWAKVLAEYPSFLKDFNALYYADPDPKNNLGGNVPALVGIAASIAPTVEGMPFGQWFQRQWILNSSVTLGRKLYTEVIPILTNLFPGETGAYALLYDLFETKKSGDEKLLAGTIFPVYWTSDFARMNLGAQYERVDVQGGTGAVAPSFTDNAQAVTVDAPTFDVLSRVTLPIGTVATQQFSHNFFGTVVGMPAGDQNGKQGTVEILTLDGPVTLDLIRGAFGGDIILPTPETVAVTVKDNNGAVLTTRQINTGPGSLAIVMEVAPATSVQQQYGKGIQMISLPIEPFERDVAALFGKPSNQFLFARWRQDLFNYALYPYTPAVQPGYAYFLKPTDPIPMRVFTGNRPPASQAHAVPLQVGWNQVGNPLLTTGATNLTDVWVQKGPEDPAIGWAEAVQKGYVAPKMYRFDQEISNPDAGVNVEATSFEAFRGYWVKALAAEGVTILFRPPSGLGPKQPYAPEKPNGWLAQLTLRSEQGATTIVEIGTDSRASAGYDPTLDAPLPPAFGATYQLAVAHADWAGANGDYASDIRAPQGKNAWTLRASGLWPGGRYTLRWPSLSALPRGLRLTLTDAASGRKINMRALTSLSFVPDSGAREFTIEAEPNALGGLQVTGLTVDVSRGGITASFALSGAASVSARVLTITGKTVSQPLSATPLTTGLHTVSWNGRDAQGVNMPPGAYLLLVEAVAEDGTAARGTRPVVLKR